MPIRAVRCNSKETGWTNISARFAGSILSRLRDRVGSVYLHSRYWTEKLDCCSGWCGRSFQKQPIPSHANLYFKLVLIQSHTEKTKMAHCRAIMYLYGDSQNVFFIGHRSRVGENSKLSKNWTSQNESCTYFCIAVSVSIVKRKKERMKKKQEEFHGLAQVKTRWHAVMHKQCFSRILA